MPITIELFYFQIISGGARVFATSGKSPSSLGILEGLAKPEGNQTTPVRLDHCNNNRTC